MKEITLTIDGKKIKSRAGDTILWAALANGIYIPNLCAIHDAEKPAASCRLCFVEVEGKAQPVTACTEAVADGMVVNTKRGKALRLARSGFELLMASHPVDCAHCLKNGSCELQKIAHHLKVSLKAKRFRRLERELPVDDSHPLFTYDPNKCVLCGRCVWVCHQKASRDIFGFAHRGFRRVVTTFADEPMAAAGCADCGDCIAVCPTGALSLKENR